MLALLAQPTIRAAAAASSTSEATLRRWLASPAFERACRRARRDALRQATTRLQAIASDGVETLRAVMNDAKAPAAARVTAARAVIELAYRGFDLEELAERVAALEAAQQHREDSHENAIAHRTT